MPLVNRDGAGFGTRANAINADLNRVHRMLAQPETKAPHFSTAIYTQKVKNMRNHILGPLFVLFGFCIAAVSSSNAGEARPNIVILYADDLGYGDLGCYNAASQISTPNLDRLASEGMRFTDGHSSSGICTPSRYALLTGRYHWRKFHGIVNAFGSSVFAPERLTLSEMLRSVGYSTACIGKWHLGWDWAAIRKPGATQVGNGRRKAWSHNAFDWSKPIPDGPLAHGFDYYFGDTVINFPPYVWIEDDKLVQAPDTMMDTATWKPIKEGNWECRSGPMVTGWDPYQVLPTLTRKGVEYIWSRREADCPFFLYFAFPCPHAPIIPNDAFDGKSKAGPYGDFVVETDDAVGQLLRALEIAGLADNTIVVFTADNGPEKYAYARDGKFGHWSSHPFRGLKRDIYEGGHHVPFIVRWSSVVEPVSVTNALASQIDLMATFASATGFDLPNDAAEDSHDLLPLLRGQRDSIRTALVHNTFVSKFAVRSDDYLLVDATDGYSSGRNSGWEARHSYPADDNQPAELYHLGEDPGQRHNLATSHPEKVTALREILNRIREQ